MVCALQLYDDLVLSFEFEFNFSYSLLGLRILTRSCICPQVAADWFDSNVEIPIRIQSQHIQHWLFAKVSKQQFMTTWKNDWDIAPAMVAPVNGAFTVLADNSRAAQVPFCFFGRLPPHELIPCL
jgi:hypothetical protein